MNHREKALEVFSKELASISDTKMRNFVLDVFEKLTPNYFWTCPASTTGKYHPSFALGKGGLIRHVKACIWWIDQVLNMVDFDNFNTYRLYDPFRMTTNFCYPDPYDGVINKTKIRDILVATLLLHDLRKNGDSLEEKKEKGYNMTQTHGVDLAKKIRQEIKIPRGLSYIVYGIEGHMGKWTKPESSAPLKMMDTMRESKRKGSFVAELVHLIDYLASRKTEELPNFVKKN